MMTFDILEERMEKSILRSLVTYNQFANNKLSKVIGQLEDDLLVKQSSPSHQSVKNLLQHMYACEHYFFSQAMGLPLMQLAPGNLEELFPTWHLLNQKLLEYFDQASEEDLLVIKNMEPGNGKSFQLPAWQLILQGLQHSNHHRGELSIVLTQLDSPLPTMDIILHFLEESGQEW